MKSFRLKAIKRAEHWLNIADQFELAIEKTSKKQLSKLLQTPKDKYSLVTMLDRVLRPKSNSKKIEQLDYILDQFGIPDFFSFIEKIMTLLFLNFGKYVPNLTMTTFEKTLKEKTKLFIYLQKSKEISTSISRNGSSKINLNPIGELVLGENDIQKKMGEYKRIIKEKNVQYLSLKLSNLYSKFQYPLSFVQAKSLLIKRVVELLEFSQEYQLKFNREQWINLDMEMVNELYISVDVFKSILANSKYKDVKLSIAIQAYLPQSKEIIKELLELAKKRYEKGGAPTRIRLVKGANLKMERVVSSQNNWPLPIYSSKKETDINYRSLLKLCIDLKHRDYLVLGVASHNILDLAYATVLIDEHKLGASVHIEMLEGLANNFSRIISNKGYVVLMYVPIVEPNNFLDAVSYLVRRFDEQTDVNNFLAQQFSLKTNGAYWKKMKENFRNEDKKLKKIIEQKKSFHSPKLNFSIPQIQSRMQFILSKIKKQKNREIVLNQCIGNKKLNSKNVLRISKFPVKECKDSYLVEMIENEAQIDKLILVAEKHEWLKSTRFSRQRILTTASNDLEEKREFFLEYMLKISGKPFEQADVEISEAIDFLRYYPKCVEFFEKEYSRKLTPKGVVLVISPWNFSLAIPIGGVVASLAVGNAVILKPSPEVFPIAYYFCELLWGAGVPKTSLQLAFCAEGSLLNYLSSHSRVNHILFTGSTKTAKQLLEARNGRGLSAETGGKNVILITQMADYDLAILATIESAFGFSGQKCSAASLLFLTDEVYNDPIFQHKLKDAAMSLSVGALIDLNTQVGPLINLEKTVFKNIIMTLEKGEKWLIEPSLNSSNVMSVGIKWGVSDQSEIYKKELFAPILSVVNIGSIENGIELINSHNYALTSGLMSLDEREQELWKSKVRVGNLYINRCITGAIVNRQPFGGYRDSSVGFGFKAGGPNYVLNVAKISEKPVDLIDKKIKPLIRLMYGKLDPFYVFIEDISEINKDDEKYIKSICDHYLIAHHTYFSKSKFTEIVIGEKNILRYLPIDDLCIRLNEEDSLLDIMKVLLALTICTTKAVVSVKKMNNKKLRDFLKSQKNIEYIEESLDACFERLIEFSSVRSLSDLELKKKHIQTISKKNIRYLSQAPINEGRIELLFYLKEQTISQTTHRYGNELF